MPLDAETESRGGILDRFKLAGVIATWWTDTFVPEKLAPPTSPAKSGNHAPPAFWHSGGANVTFLDGHAKWMREEDEIDRVHKIGKAARRTR